MIKRRRQEQSISLTNTLAVFANQAREQAELLPPGALRDELIRKARQAETELHIDAWANSPGLQPPE